MSSSRKDTESKEDKHLSGCDTMDALWKAAQACYLTKPGISGEPERVMNFVTCRNIYPFMRITALKCWQERTKLGTNSSALFTPLNLSDETERSEVVETSDDQNKQVSSEQSQTKLR